MGREQFLDIGRTFEGHRPFRLSRDFQVQTFADIGIRGSGKTVLATCLAEELCKQGLLWIALDPISVWWGLRAGKDGNPRGGYPVVVFGGKHGDLPIGKDDGRRIAELVTSESIFAVIDVKQESKRFWHTFMTDFSLGLMDQEPELPRHLFIEEAPEFVPQKTKVDLTARCKEAVERLIRLGRNQGYGCTLISQRCATIDKDVLSQCENLFVLRSVGKHDYNALKDWLKSVKGEDSVQPKDLKDLATLPSGTAYFWSPHWAQEFTKIEVRQRETFHPGDTRKVGVAARSVELAPISEIISRLQRRLSKTVVAVVEPPAKPARSTSKGTREEDHSEPAPRPEKKEKTVHPETLEELTKLREKNEALSVENSRLRSQVKEVNTKLDAVRKAFEPQFKAMSNLFEEIGATGSETGAGEDPAKWEDWLKKAGRKGCRRQLEVMLEKGRLTAIQLATLSGISYKTLKNYRGWMKNNGLVNIEGEGESAIFTIIPMA